MLIPHPSDSPVVSLGANDTTLWRLDRGVVRNRGGAIAAVVTTRGLCVCCTAAEAAIDARRVPAESGTASPRLCVDAVLTLVV